MSKKVLLLLTVFSLVFLTAVSLSAAEVLREGSQGASVEAVQEKLNQVGYEVNIDGIFGPGTREALIDFQSGENLTPDGVFGPKTSATLNQAVAEVQKASTTTYTVQSGDTLSQIASKFDSEIDEIMRINGLSDYMIYPGDELDIPSGEAGNIVSQSEGQQESRAIKYEVQQGDSLSVIASRHGVDIDDIRKANNISGDRIIAGETLKIPVSGSVFQSAGRTSSIEKLSWPVQGNITSGFGNRVHPVTRSRNFHTGIDISTGYGEQVKAADSGRVVHSGWMGGYGHTVIIDHGNNKETLYAHNSRLYVRQGQRVSRGEVIAAVGNSGTATGSHLHFEVIINGKHQNPENYLP